MWSVCCTSFCVTSYVLYYKKVHYYKSVVTFVRAAAIENK